MHITVVTHIPFLPQRSLDSVGVRPKHYLGPIGSIETYTLGLLTPNPLRSRRLAGAP